LSALLHLLASYHLSTILPSLLLFFFNDTATTEIYTLSLHDALPISRPTVVRRGPERRAGEPHGRRQRGGSRPNSAQRGRVAADEARRHPGAQDRRGPHRLPDFEDRSPASDTGYGEIPGTGTRGRQDPGARSAVPLDRRGHGARELRPGVGAADGEALRIDYTGGL